MGCISLYRKWTLVDTSPIVTVSMSNKDIDRQLTPLRWTTTLTWRQGWSHKRRVLYLASMHTLGLFLGLSSLPLSHPCRYGLLFLSEVKVTKSVGSEQQCKSWVLNQWLRCPISFTQGHWVVCGLTPLGTLDRHNDANRQLNSVVANSSRPTGTSINQNFYQTFIVPISPAKPGSVAQVTSFSNLLTWQQMGLGASSQNDLTFCHKISTWLDIALCDHWFLPVRLICYISRHMVKILAADRRYMRTEGEFFVKNYS